VAKKTSGRGGGELYETPSGMIHGSSSLADMPEGRFVKNFGPPGDPETKDPVAASRFPGKQGVRPGLYLQGERGKK
jgi:hypothetical protein